MSTYRRCVGRWARVGPAGRVEVAFVHHCGGLGVVFCSLKTSYWSSNQQRVVVGWFRRGVSLCCEDTGGWGPF